jgi:hypothetical protein
MTAAAQGEPGTSTVNSADSTTSTNKNNDHNDHHNGNGKKHFILSPEISSYFIAGGVAGATSRTVVSPLERIKIIQ